MATKGCPYCDAEGIAKAAAWAADKEAEKRGLCVVEELDVQIDKFFKLVRKCYDFTVLGCVKCQAKARRAN